MSHRLLARARRALATPSLPWTYFASHPHAPLLAQVVVTRRCNLKCAYCNEYDRVSAPVDTARLRDTSRVLARLHTRAVAFTGGEPTLHPELPRVVADAVSAGIPKVTMITNGYKLTPELIGALNDAGLTRMQLSLDGVTPNETTAKVLNCTDRKLRLLAEHARFAVHVNAVLGAVPVRDTRAVLEFAADLGFETTVQWLHGDGGAAQNPHGVTDDDVEALRAIGRPPPHHATSVLGAHHAEPWKCRAGARYVYVDEFSVARTCSQSRDLWACPIDEVTDADLARNFHMPKPCAPGCTLGCARDASQYDHWRPQSGPTPRMT